MRKLRVSVMMLEDFVPPDDISGLSDKEMAPWKTEYDVLTALEHIGHEVTPMPVLDDLSVIGKHLKKHEPHVIFNLLEEFSGRGIYVPYVLGYLELIRRPYTGCNPYGITLTHNKAHAKKILRFHRIPVPDFGVCGRGRKVRVPKRLAYPLIVKSTTEHGSVGISQASVVYDFDQLVERVAFVHETQQTDAIIEEYIDGRELYVGLIGNTRVDVLPIWEMDFGSVPEGAPKIATEKVKWDLKYQDKRKITTRRAKGMSDKLQERITRVSKRAYRILGQSGYARMDLRVTDDERVYLIESNPNPQIAYDEDFAESAAAGGVSYNELIQRVLNLGLRYSKSWAD